MLRHCGYLLIVCFLTIATVFYTRALLSAGDHDDRVVPLHSHKLTATLQHVLCEDAESPQRNPLITRIDVRAGHGAGKPTEKIIAGALFACPNARACWLLWRGTGLVCACQRAR